MNNNDFSFESIFAAGMGIPTDNRVEARSEERFDGNFDTVFAEISRSEEELNFVESFGSLENYNTKAKLDMLNKINKAYGKCNRGIENYCRSLEAEDNTNKKGFVSNIVSKLVNILKKIWAIIVNFFKQISLRVKSFFNKNKLKNEVNKSQMNEQERQNLNKFIDEMTKITTQLQSAVIKYSSEVELNTKDTTNETDKFYKKCIEVQSYNTKVAIAFSKLILKVFQKIFSNITRVRVSGPTNTYVFNMIKGSFKYHTDAIRMFKTYKSNVKEKYENALNEECVRGFKSWLNILITFNHKLYTFDGSVNIKDFDSLQKIRSMYNLLAEKINNVSQDLDDPKKFKEFMKGSYMKNITFVD